MMTSVLRFKYLFTSIFVIIGFGLWLTYPRHYEFNGTAFGTYYKVIVTAPKYAINEPTVQIEINNRLALLDQRFSTYRPDSELMAINNAEVNVPVTASAEVLSLINRAFELQKKIGPVWDPTVVPLSTAYGFGGVELASKPDQIGLGHISVINQSYITKSAKVAIDLSSIAKGYAVDQLTLLLNGYNIKGSYVDIGGEIRTTGQKPDGTQWGIGIQSPLSSHNISHLVYANNLSIATSGNYLNYVKKDGEKIGHILNPVTGKSLSHDLLSVSVIAKDCTTADAVATGLFVMGLEKAKKWLKDNTDIAALIVYQDGNKIESFIANDSNLFQRL